MTDTEGGAVSAAARRLSARRQRDALPHRIETARLVLRAPIRGDVPDLVRLADNRKIFEMLIRLPHPYTRADGIAFVEIFAQRADERPYAVTLDDRFIGIVGLSFHPGEPPELGYWLGEPYWGRGIMSEAVKALLDTAFATGLYPQIRARAASFNPGSIAVLEKAGFRRIGEGKTSIGTVVERPTLFFMVDQPRWM